tara:strand:- start:712 stop:1632 length:921 start_codon:yes stop_codon:yes gene_type:complete
MKRLALVATVVLMLGLVYWIGFRPGLLIVRTNASGVTVLVDGTPYGETTIDGLAVEVSRGAHFLRLEREGFESIEESILVQGDSVVVVRMLAPLGMVFIEGGTFTMGDDDGAYSERPAHRVTLRPYFMDRTEVSMADYRRFRTRYTPPFDGDGLPATNVTWADATAFCRRQGKRLPTEAEWERACRGSDDRVYANGHRYDSTVARVGKGLYAGPVVVDEHPPGPEGIYHLTGNVWEWCSDWYDRGAYRNGDRDNPSGPREGTRRALRGGAWYSNERYARCTHRPGNFRASKDPSFGFRCAKDTFIE